MKKTSEHFGVKVWNFNIPNYQSDTGKITCPFAGPCKDYCYVDKNNYLRFAHNVRPHMERNLELTRQDDFVQVMDLIIKGKRKIDFLRVHDSGDYYSPKYLNDWLTIARLNPQVKLYSYTKSNKMVLDADIPENFDFIFSEGGKLDHMISDDVRHAKIFPDSDSILQAGYTDASDYDLLATKWYTESNRIGLRFH